MVVVGESQYISKATGSKNGKEWFSLKFLDEDAEEFFRVFVEKDIFTKMADVEKNTPVMLTLTITPGSSYWRFEAIEILK